MRLSDFLLLSLICLVWGLNLVATRWVVADVPPLAYAFLRFALIAVVLAPFLFPAPRNLGLVALVGLCIGGLNFAFLFIALKNGTASSVAIAGQLGLPFSTILSMAFLGETVGWRRGLGMGLAFAGVVLIAYDPNTFGLSLGVAFAVLAALVGSVGGIIMKRMEPIGPFQLQAWVAMVSWPILLPLTLATETGQIAAVQAGGWGFLAALAFSVFAVSIFGHGMFYEIVKKYEVTLVSPLTLMTPVWAVVFGVLLLHETLTPQLAGGAALALTGVGMIAARPNAALRKLSALFREWTS
ncbi:MAG: DMT family transporter [Alphaproteobacteria bacterium]|nr:DMT family transporter [Alphaproteobacteria bacterium]